MKKKVNLNQIDRKNLFEVPDAYFEKLPEIIQSKAIKSEKRLEWLPTIPAYVKWGIVPALVLAFTYILWFSPTDKDLTAEELLATVDTEDIIEYLNTEDYNTDDLIENIEWEGVNLEEELPIELEEEDINTLLLDYEITGEYN